MIRIHSVLLLAFVLGSTALFCLNCTPALRETTVETGSESDLAQKDVSVAKTAHANGGYVYWFADSHGIYRYDSGNDSTLKVFSNGDLLWSQVELSPDRTRIAFVYKDGESRNLAVLDTRAKQVWKLHSIPLRFHYFSFKWAANSQLLGVGFYGESSFYGPSKQKEGDLFVCSYDGTMKRSIGCRVSRIFRGWLPDGSILVEGPKNIYVVDTTSCKTMFSIDGSDKRYVTLSPDGRKLLYLKDKDVYDIELSRSRNIPELCISDFDGQNEEVIIDYRYGPKQPEWSPDGKEIVCVIESAEWADELNIAVYSLTVDSMRYLRERAPSKVWKPRWSPDGTRIVYNRQFQLSPDYENIPAYWKRSKTIFDLQTGQEFVVREVIAQTSTPSLRWTGSPLGETWGWVNNDNLVIQFRAGTWIYDLRGNVLDSLPLCKPVFVGKSDSSSRATY